MILLLFAASGCAALVYEIVWFQELQLVIGASAVSRADFGEYASWTLAKSQGPIAIRRVYDELSGALR